jgi:hypothetical protein
MVDRTANLISSIVEFAKTLVWPAVLIWIVQRFRAQLSDLLKRLGSVKVAGNEFSFEKAIVQQSQLVLQAVSTEPDNKQALEAAKKLSLALASNSVQPASPKKLWRHCTRACKKSNEQRVPSFYIPDQSIDDNLK